MNVNVVVAFQSPKDAFVAMMIPTITPNNPKALPKISITKIFTKRVEF